MRTAPPSAAMNDSPMRPPPPKLGTTKTSMVVGSPSSNALISVRSSTVPAIASTSVKCWSPSSRSTLPMHTDSVASPLTGPRAGGSRVASCPFFFRTSTSEVPNAPAAIAGLSEMRTSNPARATAAAITLAAPSGRVPAAIGTLTSRPSTRTRTAPPLAGSPCSHPTARRWGRGGSTTVTESSRGGPKLIPHPPHIRLARSTSRRASSMAAASSRPSGGGPFGVSRTRSTRSLARYRAIGPAGDCRGPRTRIICALSRRDEATASAPPSSALMLRSATRG